MVNRTRYRNELGQIDAVRPSSGGITLTIDHTKVSDDLTNFPVYVNLNDVKSGITLAEAQSIRIYKADGTTELPRDIVTKDKMWFKADLSSSTDTVFKIKMDGVSADYGVSDTYGRNNVYTKYKAFYDFASGNSNDRTGNGYNGTDSNVTYSGDYASFNGSSSYITLPTIAGGSSYYMSSRLYAGSVTGSGGSAREILFMGASGGNISYETSMTSQYYRDGSFNGQVSYNYTTGSIINVATMYDHSTSTHSRIQNGVVVGTSVKSVSLPASRTNNKIGNHWSAPTYFDGRMYYMGIANVTPSSTRVSTEYNNQSSPSTFYTIS